MAEYFLRFQGLPAWVLLLILTTIVTIFTEVTSNVATVTIFLPIVSELVSILLQYKFKYRTLPFMV